MKLCRQGYLDMAKGTDLLLTVVLAAAWVLQEW